MNHLTFTDEELQILHQERFEHPHPRVQLWMEVLWLIGQGQTYSQAARLAGVSEATVDRYVGLFRQGGLDGTEQKKRASCEHFTRASADGLVVLLPCSSLSPSFCLSPTVSFSVWFLRGRID